MIPSIRNQLSYNQTRRNGSRSSSVLAVVVSAGGSPGAFDIVRCLGMSGINSCVASSQDHDIAFYSRHCVQKVVLPPFSSKHHEEILQSLKSLGKGFADKPVLFYVSDAELTFVWKFRDELKKCYRFLLPRNELLEQLFNKVRFTTLALTHHLPVPYTVTVSGARELHKRIREISFPCIVKPAFSQDWIWDTPEQWAKFGPYKKALRRFDSERELLEFCDQLPQRSSGFLIQSYVDGRDESIVSFHGYFDEKSRCLGWFVGRKIRTFPPHTGGSVYIRTTKVPDLGTGSIGFLQRMQFQGIVKIDYKWNEHRRLFEMLEINPRYNLWQVLGTYAGVNLALLALRNQLGWPMNPQNGYTDNVRLLYVKQDLRSFFTGYRMSREWTIRSYIRSVLSRKYFRVFNPVDPAPFVISVLGFLKRNIFRLLPSGINRPLRRRTAVVSHNAAESEKSPVMKIIGSNVTKVIT